MWMCLCSSKTHRGQPRCGCTLLFSPRRADFNLQALTFSFSIHVNTLTWLAQRREIRSFFIAEVNRDKIVLSGKM